MITRQAQPTERYIKRRNLHHRPVVQLHYGLILGLEKSFLNEMPLLNHAQNSLLESTNRDCLCLCLCFSEKTDYVNSCLVAIQGYRISKTGAECANVKGGRATNYY